MTPMRLPFSRPPRVEVHHLLAHVVGQLVLDVGVRGSFEAKVEREGEHVADLYKDLQNERLWA